MSKLKPLLLAFFWGMGAGSLVQAEDEVWKLPSAQARCVLVNKDAYIATGEPVLMIISSACPEVDTATALALLTKNSVVPSVTIVEETEIDDIIVYTADELSCLAVESIDFSGEVVSLPKRPQC